MAPRCALLSLVGHFADGVLRPRHRHAVARYEMIVCAVFMMKAASSVVAEFDRMPLPHPHRRHPVPPPKPPSTTQMNERFIAWHMMKERMAPDDPTSTGDDERRMPSVKPMPTRPSPRGDSASTPSTGMSAPPIGTIRSPPNSSASTTRAEEVDRAAGHHEADNEDHQRDESRMLMRCRAEEARAAADARTIRRKAMDRAGETQRADGAERHFHQASCEWMLPGVPMSKASGA